MPINVITQLFTLKCQHLTCINISSKPLNRTLTIAFAFAIANPFSLAFIFILVNVSPSFPHSLPPDVPDQLRTERERPHQFSGEENASLPSIAANANRHHRHQHHQSNHRQGPANYSDESSAATTSLIPINSEPSPGLLRPECPDAYQFKKHLNFRNLNRSSWPAWFCCCIYYFWWQVARTV